MENNIKHKAKYNYESNTPVAGRSAAAASAAASVIFDL